MTEKRHKFQSLRFLTFFPVFVIKVILDTLQKSRVLQEDAAAVQQISTLTCVSRMLLSTRMRNSNIRERNANKEILAVVYIMGLKDTCIILVAYKDTAWSQGQGEAVLTLVFC